MKTYALQSFADFRCRIVETLLDGMLLNLDGTEVWVKFLGKFNAYNLLSVYAAAILLGADRNEVLRILSELTSVNGRFEPIHSPNGVTAIVDYAHTPDALQNVISTINEIRKKGQKLYVVVGCGGNRDATKRPEMAKIAVDGSDMAILTSDNPRLEKPEDIIEQMKAGIEPGVRYLAITDRQLKRPLRWQHQAILFWWPAKDTKPIRMSEASNTTLMIAKRFAPLSVCRNPLLIGFY